MPAATIQTDHAGVAKATLPKQFKDKATILALIEAEVGPSNPTTWGVQDLENVFFQIRDNCWLDTSVGEQLDLLGRILGLKRTSTDDEIYRDALLAQIVINTSQGDPETLIRLLYDLTAPNSVQYVQGEGSFYSITAINATRDDEISRFHAASLAGVAHIINVGEEPTPFILGRGVDATGALDSIFDEHPVGEGFGTVGAGDGGKWVSMRSQSGD